MKEASWKLEYMFKFLRCTLFYFIHMSWDINKRILCKAQYFPFQPDLFLFRPTVYSSNTVRWRNVGTLSSTAYKMRENGFQFLNLTHYSVQLSAWENWTFARFYNSRTLQRQYRTAKNNLLNRIVILERMNKSLSHTDETKVIEGLSELIWFLLNGTKTLKPWT